MTLPEPEPKSVPVGEHNSHQLIWQEKFTADEHSVVANPDEAYIHITTDYFDGKEHVTDCIVPKNMVYVELLPTD
jgi:hypothetical protein